MTTTGTFTDAYPKKTGYRLELIVERAGIDDATRKTTWNWKLQARSTGGGQGGTDYETTTTKKDSKGKDVKTTVQHSPTFKWTVEIEGQKWNGYAKLDFSSSYISGIESGSTKPVSPSAAGGLDLNVSATHDIDDTPSWGRASITGVVKADSVAYAAGAPSTPDLRQQSTLTSVYPRGTKPDSYPAPSSYDWQISSDETFGRVTQSYSGNSLTPTFDNLAYGTTYFVRYRAVNSKGTSPWSASLTASTPGGLPGSPTTPTQARTSEITRIFAAGTKPDLTPPATAYQWQVASDEYFGTVVWEYGGDSLGIVADGLTFGTDYYVRYKAVNSLGSGPWSATAKIATLGAVPGVPTPPALRARPTLFALYARGVEQPGLYPPARGYSWQISSDEYFNEDVRAPTRGDGGLTPDFEGLTWGTTYYVRYRTYNDLGTGAWSTSLTASTLGTIPSAPSSPELRDTTGLTTLYLRAVAALGYPMPYEYDWQLSLTPTFTGGTQNYTGPNLEPNWYNLLPNRTYYARVRSRNILGTSAWSSAFETTTLTLPPVAPAAPTKIASGITTLTLQGVQPDLRGGTLAKYTWFLYDADGVPGPGTTAFADPLQTDDTGLLRHTFDGLVPGKTYYAGFTATNENGQSELSGLLTAVTTALTPPSLRIEPTPDGTAAIVTASYDDLRQPDTFRVKAVWMSGAAAPSVQPTDYDTVPFTLAGLVPGATYAWSVAAIFIEDGGKTYVSSYSAAVTIAQPTPNTASGAFFSGAYAPPTSAFSVSWTGTANASTSVASAPGVNGWSVDAASGGSAVIYRAVGGHSGTYSARVLVKSDVTGALSAGQGGAGNALRSAVTAGETYWGSCWVSPDRTQPMRAYIRWYTAAGVFVSETLGDVSLAVLGTWTRFVVKGVAPATATVAEVRVRDDTASGSFSPWLAGEGYFLDDLMITYSLLYDYFAGDTPDDVQYDYGWVGTAGASASYRQLQRTTGPDLLLDPSAPVVPTIPKPPVVVDTTITSVGIWQRYWAEVPRNRVSPWQTMIPTFTITSGDKAIRQVRIRVYENPDALRFDQINPADWTHELTLSYLPTRTVAVLDGVTRRAWASVRGGLPVPADKLLYGTLGGPATWPELDCGLDYFLAFDVPRDTPLANSDIAVALTRRL